MKKKKIVIALGLILINLIILCLLIFLISHITDNTWKNIFTAITLLGGSGVETLLTVSITNNIDDHSKHDSHDVNSKCDDHSKHDSHDVNSNNKQINVSGDVYNNIIPKKLKESDYGHHEYITNNMDLFISNDELGEYTYTYKDNGKENDFKELDNVRHYLISPSTIFSKEELNKRKEELYESIRKFKIELALNTRTFGQDNGLIGLYFSFAYCANEHPELFEECTHIKITDELIETFNKKQEQLENLLKDVKDKYKKYVEKFIELSD